MPPLYTDSARGVTIDASDIDMWLSSSPGGVRPKSFFVTFLTKKKLFNKYNKSICGDPTDAEKKIVYDYVINHTDRYDDGRGLLRKKVSATHTNAPQYTRELLIVLHTL